MPRPSPRWDIFCAVVDNFGDAAVAWRLARILASEHDLPVRLYIDALPTLSRLAPDVDPARERQQRGGVEVCAWRGPRSELVRPNPGAVVIEAFGCGLPASYLQAMAERDEPPLWINLEYLSAEKWIEDCHGLASRHPTLPLTRYFFFPGFTPESGGLLRECDLVDRRDAFRSDPGARAAVLRALGVEPRESHTIVSLFCYPDAPIGDLLGAWIEGDAPILCLVPPGVAEDALARWAGADAGAKSLSRGALTLERVPFVPQDEYDRLLWTCDINFVRGEDSFVRAQWAARALVWHAYPQTENAHRLKVGAFLDRYAAAFDARTASAAGALSRAWNGDGDVRAAWSQALRRRDALALGARTWADTLAQEADLATELVRFCRDRL